MAQGHQDRMFRFENVSIVKNEDSQLGVGSYGVVYRAKCDQLPCAAKILHPAFFQTNDPGSQRLLERFELECGFMSSVRHPNIVQYLGTCQDRDSQLPVLLMELLDSSLTKYLETSNKPISYHVQVDLCFDIALIAIAYLHSNGIIHRDLSGKNVLIMAGSRAKVTDFGMSKLVGASSRISRRSLTKCPGTEVYMPPEAFIEPPVYTKKLDCFSFGVLVIQTLTRLFPDPGPRTRQVPFLASPSGQLEMPVIDTERRKQHIDRIPPAHPLLPIAKECLQYNQDDRPSAQQLCEQLATVKEAPQYSESKQRVQESSSPVENDTTDKDRTIQELQQQVDYKERVIQENAQIIEENYVAIQAKNLAIIDYESIISEKERMLCDLNRQLQDNEQVIAGLLAQSERENRGLRDSLPARDCTDINNPQHQQLTIEEPQAKVHVDTKMAKASSIKLHWRDGGRVPEKMVHGSSTVHGNMAYFRDEGSVSFNVHAHNAATGKWELLPKLPYDHSSIVVVNGLLTAVGGWRSSAWSWKDTNKIFSLDGKGQWVEQLPCMPMARRHTAVACSGKTLVVAGGMSFLTKLSAVQLLDTAKLQWFIGKELPRPVSAACAIVCGDNLYVVGGTDASGGNCKSLFTCSLSALIMSAKPATPGGQSEKPFSQTKQIWREVLVSLPVVSMVYTSFSGQLIAVGGLDSDYNQLTSSIFAYDPTSNQWNVISMMPTARCCCLIAVLPGNQLMVVGGYTTSDCFGSASNKTDKVEIATF